MHSAERFAALNWSCRVPVLCVFFEIRCFSVHVSINSSFSRSFVRLYQAHSARHTPTSPEKAYVGGAHTDTKAADTRGCGGTQAQLHHLWGRSQPARAKVWRLARCSRGPALPPALACVPGCVRRIHYVVPHLRTLLSHSLAPGSGVSLRRCPCSPRLRWSRARRRLEAADEVQPPPSPLPSLPHALPSSAVLAPPSRRFSR